MTTGLPLSLIHIYSQLFSMSVYENITFSGPLKENGPRFEDAAEKAGIKGKIAGLSNAEDTICLLYTSRCV